MSKRDEGARTPEGWVTVPREPTEAMLRAYHASWVETWIARGLSHNDHFVDWDEWPEDAKADQAKALSAMLDAAREGKT